MVCTFDWGIGLVLIAGRDKADGTLRAILNAGQDKVYTIAEVVSSLGVETLEGTLQGPLS
jgi:hypothetical protein